MTYNRWKRSWWTSIFPGFILLPKVLQDFAEQQGCLVSLRVKSGGRFTSRWLYLVRYFFIYSFECEIRMSNCHLMVTPPAIWQRFRYTWLDKTFVGTAGKIVAKKVLLDQFLFTPPMMCLFFTTLGYLEGRQNLFEEFQQKFPTTFTVLPYYIGRK